MLKISLLNLQKISHHAKNQNQRDAESHYYKVRIS